MTTLFGSDRLDIETFDPMRSKSDDQAVKEGYVWSPEKALNVQGFIESLCRLNVDRWADQPIQLMGYQQDFVWRLYGWVHQDTGLRRFREAYLEVAKKNGKSPLIASLANYHLMADGVFAPEVYLNASARDQTGPVFQPVKSMVELEPKFYERLLIRESRYEILYPEKNGKLKANSAESGSKDGFQSSFTVFDELHRQPDRKLWDVFQYAGKSRLEPLLVSITTAGEPDDNHPCYLQHKRALEVENGSRLDVRFLGVVYGPREKNPDIDDRRVWRMANPAMGVIFSEEDFAADLEKAKNEGPAALANFKRLNLNIWEKVAPKWVDMTVWAEQAPTRTDEEIAESGDVWAAGLDLSGGDDLSAYVRVAGTVKDGVDVRAWFWIPEETAIRRQREENLPYLEYAERGWVFLTPGSVIDPMEIRDFILEDAAKLGGRLKRIHSDFYNAKEVGNSLTAAGLDFQWFIQGHLSFHRPIKTIQNLLARRLLRHGDNPVLNYCAGNVVVDIKNINQNMMFAKHKSTGRIDGMVGVAEGLAGLMDVIGYDGEGGEEAAKPKPITKGRFFWKSY